MTAQSPEPWPLMLGRFRDLVAGLDVDPEGREQLQEMVRAAELPEGQSAPRLAQLNAFADLLLVLARLQTRLIEAKKRPANDNGRTN